MDEPKRGFTGYFIPVEIVNDPNLRPVEKLLLAEIHALQKGDPRGCRASNQHLGQHVGMTAGSVANSITKLRSMGYIRDVHFDGRTRFIVAVLLPDVSCWETSSTNEGSIHPAMKINTQGNLLSLPIDKSISVNLQSEQIWKTYPRRAGKPAAIAAIKRAIKRVGFDQLMKATKAFAAARPNKNDPFTPWPQKWFNQERYNDDPATWLSAPKPLTAVERGKRKGKLQDELNALFRRAKARQQPGEPLYTEAEQQQKLRLKQEIEQL